MHIVRCIAGRLFVLFAIISAIFPAAAREKTDVVILKNGDHISCEIQSLSRGMLSVKTDPMSTVNIKWPDVASVTSTHMFVVEDTQGRIYVGSLSPVAGEWRVYIAGSQGGIELDHLSVVEIQELEGSRWQRFSGSADFSLSFTKASELVQFNFSGDVMYRTEKYSSQLSYSSTLGKSQGETDADRNLLTLTGIRQFQGKWLAYGQIGYEHNLELGLDRRFSFLGGPGYRIRQSNRALITAIAAGSITRESYYGEDTRENAEGFFAIDTQFFKLYSPKFDIVNQFAFLPNFTTRGRRRLEYKAKFRLELVKDLFIMLTFYDSYDSKPPSNTASTNDYGLTTGFSWSFRR